MKNQLFLKNLITALVIGLAIFFLSPVPFIPCWRQVVMPGAEPVKSFCGGYWWESYNLNRAPGSGLFIDDLLMKSVVGTLASSLIIWGYLSVKKNKK